MAQRLFSFVVLFIMLIHSNGLYSQVQDIDSLQKQIMKSVKDKLKKTGAASSFTDTNFLPADFSKNLDKALSEMNQGLSKAKSAGDINWLRGGYYKLSAIDSMRGNYKGAYENYKLYSLYRDSLEKKEEEKRELQAKMQYEFDKKQAVAKAEQEKNEADEKRVRNLQYFTIAGLAALTLVVLLIALIQAKNSKQRKKANILLLSQKEQVESTLSSLRSTQAQLIQSEKMASLGELTAGIAHEIQNPLNFVNNFSEVNNELLEEMSEENDVKEIRSIAGDIRENNRKIHFHGKRADNIVKGMLQHAQSSSGVKEPVDLNALAEEYLQLAYHGFRSKDKLFHVKLHTQFDPSVGKINMIAQDIGRVLLNLFNNAFYAVNERKRNSGETFEPSVQLRTKKAGKQVILSVEDNGEGIPDNLKEKIFQPFFTTKPTGQGTGLGLSLAYDIVKAHGGKLEVQSTEGKGTIFNVQMPG